MRSTAEPMTIDEKVYNRMPPHLKALLDKLPNPGSEEVLEVFGRAGVRTSGKPTVGRSTTTDAVYGKYNHRSLVGSGDSGSAARFFYTAKASKSERNAGIDGSNPHPTVKPLSLVEYLARLILVPPAYRDTAQILIPYAGVFSEAIGAMRAGWQNITVIEQDPEYIEIGKRRFAHWSKACATVLHTD